MTSSKVRLSPALALFSALVCLRYQLVSELRIDFSDALSAQFLLGALYDFAYSLLPGALGLLIYSFLGFPRSITWAVGALLIWSSVLANALYFKTHREPLDWWTVQLRLKEVEDVFLAAGDIVPSPALIASAGFLLIGLFLIFKKSPREVYEEAGEAKFTLGFRSKHFFGALEMIVAFLVLKNAPVWLGMTHPGSQHQGNLMNNHILTVWWDQAMYEKGRARVKNPTLYTRKLAEYRDWRGRGPYKEITPGWPLQTQFRDSPRLTRQLRLRLGMEPSQPPNIILLIVDSARVFELLHRDLRREIFPNLRTLLKKYSVFFEQAYSSAANAGTAERGLFSIHCSFLPNILGPATLFEKPTIRTTCAPDYFRSTGYQVLSFTGESKSRSNRGLFESFQGTHEIFDDSYFGGLGINETVGAALADKPVLAATVDRLEKRKDPRPFFATVTAVSGRFPHKAITDAKLSDKMIEATVGHPEYRAYLSQLKYMDQALTHFFEKFFASQLARNTVVMLVGANSVPVLPHIKMTYVQTVELKHRVMMAIVSRRMRRPGRIKYPVHQVDVLPTLARLAGRSARVSWLGRGLLSGQGSPWVFQAGPLVYYRTNTRGCYPDSGQVRCFLIPKGSDPLYQTGLRNARQQEGLLTFFRKVAEASGVVLQHNLVLPYEIKK